MDEIGLNAAVVRGARRLTTEGRIQIATVLGAWAIWEALARSGLFYRDIIPSSLKIFAA